MEYASYQNTKNCLKGSQYLLQLEKSFLTALQNLFVFYQSSPTHFSCYSLQLLRKVILILKHQYFKGFNIPLSDIADDILQHFDIGQQNNV